MSIETAKTDRELLYALHLELFKIAQNNPEVKALRERVAKKLNSKDFSEVVICETCRCKDIEHICRECSYNPNLFKHYEAQK